VIAGLALDMLTIAFTIRATRHARR